MSRCKRSTAATLSRTARVKPQSGEHVEGYRDPFSCRRLPSPATCIMLGHRLNISVGWQRPLTVRERKSPAMLEIGFVVNGQEFDYARPKP